MNQVHLSKTTRHGRLMGQNPPGSHLEDKHKVVDPRLSSPCQDEAILKEYRQEAC